MGYDITFKEPLREDFLCVICDLALREPRQSICGHRFCHTCIESKLSDVDNFQCPLPDCGYVLIRDKIFCDMFVTRELQQQVVVCRCTWEGLLKDLDNHWRDSCIQSEVACTNVGCNTCLQRKDLEKHLQENCSMRKMSCQHCGDMFTFNNLQLDDHIAHCPLAPCHCQFSEIGCTYKGVRRLVEQHEADPTALQLHLMMMMKNQSLKDEERDLKTTILERKITELENEKALREAQCTFMRQQVDTQNEQMNALQTLIVQCNKKMEELSNVVKVMRKDLYLLEEQNQKLEDEIQQGLYSSSRMHMMKDGADYMDTVKNEIKLTNGVKHHQEPVVLKSNAQDVLVGKEITSVLLKMKENDYGQLPPHLTRFTHSEPLKGLSDDDLKERIHTLTGRTVEELLGLIDIKVTSDNLVLLSHLLIVKANQMTENDVMDEENIGACGRSRGDDNMWMSPEDDNVMQQINQLEKRVTEVEMEMMEKRSLESMSLGNHSSHLDDLLTIGSDAQISYSMAVRHNLSSLGSNGTHINVSIPTLSAVPRKNQKKQSKPKTSLNIVCYNCQKPGHKAIDCRSRKR